MVLSVTSTQKEPPPSPTAPTDQAEPTQQIMAATSQPDIPLVIDHFHSQIQRNILQCLSTLQMNNEID